MAKISLCGKRFLGAAVAAALLAPIAWAQANLTPRITQPVNESSRITLTGSVRPLANAANDTGTVSPDMRLDRIQLVFKKSASQQAELSQLLHQMHTPGSPNYHKWLTPAQFGERFGPAPQDIQTITDWLRLRGFEVGKLNPGNGSLEISGTAGQLQDTFHTSIHRYLVAGHYFYSNANDPQIPASLAPVLGGFVSLNNFPVHRLSRYLGKASYDPQTGQSAPQWTVPSSNGLGYDLVLSPQDFAVEYNIPSYNTYQGGSGQTIAIVNDANININVVNNFRSLFGLPANPPHVIIDGADPGIDGINNPSGPNGDSIEAYLDVEWAGAVAPAATVDLVIGGDTAVENGLILAAERVVFSDLAPVMSVSFGACEQILGSGNQFLNSLWQQAAAEGITVLVASGDSGSAGTDPSEKVCDTSSEPKAQFGLGVSGYASTPYDVAVGGTDFYYTNYNNPSSLPGQLQSYWNTAPSSTPSVSIKGYIPEQPWNDTALGLNIFQLSQSELVGGGGGASTCGMPQTDSSGNVTQCQPYPKPSWQTGNGVPSANARYIPDVSLFAADGINDSYYPVCAQDGDCQPGASPSIVSGVGGTSAAAPAMAGIMALVNQKYGAQGQADYVLYPLAQQHPSAFHDVTNGTNAMPCVAGSPNCSGGALTGYAATPGYDPATGWGSVNVSELLSNWNNVSFTTTTTSLSLSSTSLTHGTAITLNSSVTGSGGTPTGNIAIVTDSPSINQQNLVSLSLNSSGQASGSINFLPGGAYNVWAQYGGDGKFGPSYSSKTQVTVNPESSSIIFSAVISSQNQFQSVANQQLPYGTPIILDGNVVPTTYYNQCNQGQSQTSACQNASYGSATGTVTFSDGSSAVNTAVINSEGDAEYVTGSWALGTHSVSVKYSGDASYNASSASPVSFKIVQATPTVTITSNANPIPAGQTLVLTAVVDSNGNGAAPTGSVTFKNGATTLGAAGLVAGKNPSTGTAIGVATLSLTAPANSASITASYAGDTNYASAISSAFTLSVTGSTTKLASSVSATVAPSSTTSPTSEITFSIRVTGQNNHPAPTGSVDFQTSGVDRGAFNLTPAAGATSTATVTLNSQNLFQGANVITLYYSGDAVYQTSSTTVTINNPLADFSMIAETPVVAMSSGGSASATIDLASINGYNGGVSLTCSGSSGYSCSVNPGSLTLNGSATATVTINAPASSYNHGAPLGWFWAGGGGAAAAFVFLFGLPRRRRRWQTFLGLVVIAVLAFGIGCGGGPGSGGGGSNPPGGGGGNPPPSGGGGGTASSGSIVVSAAGGAIAHNVSIIVKIKGS